MQDPRFEFSQWQSAIRDYYATLKSEGAYVLSCTGKPIEEVKTRLARIQCAINHPELDSVVSVLETFSNVIAQLKSECEDLLPGHRIDSDAIVRGASGLFLMSEDEIRLLRVIANGLDSMKSNLSRFANFKTSQVWLQQVIQCFRQILKCLEDSLRLLNKYGAERCCIEHLDIFDASFRHLAASIDDAVLRTSRDTKERNDVAYRADDLRDIASMYGKRDNNDAQASFPVENTPPVFDSFFIGRSDELENLKAYLHPRTPSLYTKLIVLEGGGGIGKSALALKLFRVCSDEQAFDAIFWINAQAKDTIVPSLAEISGWIRHPGRGPDLEQNSMLALTWLRTTRKTWLLIYDNLDNKDLFARYYPGGHGAIVVTTRIKDLGKKLEVRHIELTRFSKPDSIVAFNHFRRIRHQDVTDSAEKEAIDKLIALLDGLALGIKQIASYIGSKKLTVEQYLAQYESMPRTALCAEDSKESQTLEKAWIIEFKDFRENTVHASQILSILSLISAHEIPMELFKLGEEDYGPEDFFDVFDQDISVQDALTILETTNLIQVDREREIIFIHRLLQIAFRYSEFGLRSQERLQEAINATAILLNNRFPKHKGNKSLYKDWSTCAVYWSHVRLLVNNFRSKVKRTRRQKLSSTPALDELLKNCCWYLYETGFYDDGIWLLGFAIDVAIDKTGLHYATLCQAYACIYLELNNLPKARFWNEECLEIRQARLNEGNPDIANVHANLANVLTAYGSYEEAIEELRLAMECLSIDNEGDLMYLGMRKMMIGRAYYFANRDSEAQQCYQESDDVFNKIGPNQFMKSALCHDQGNLQLRYGNVYLALQKFEDGFKLANSHRPSTSIAGINLYAMGVAQLMLRNYRAARTSFEDALKIAKFRSLHGQEARIFRKQAELYEKDPEAPVEEKSKVRELREKAEKIKNDLLKVNAGVYSSPWATEDEEYDSLVCVYFR